MTAPHAKPRLFFDCPLKAAFMAKYFGMRYEGNPGFPLQALTGQTFDSENGWSRVYLDDASLRLLEPQVGDIIKAEVWSDFICTADALFAYLKYPGSKTWDGGRFESIIQRKDTPFMWPDRESEAA